MLHITVFLIVVIILLFYCVKYFKYVRENLTYVRSSIDGVPYLVRDIPDKQKAADMLAQLKQRSIELAEKLYSNMDEALRTSKVISKEEHDEFREYITRLHQSVTNIVYSENGNNNDYTSYSVNKGEQIVFCIRSKETDEIYNVNLIMYVVLHELAHVACPIYDNHGPLFRKIFAFLVEFAIKTNLYIYIPFDKSPVQYCGMTITDSII